MTTHHPTDFFALFFFFFTHFTWKIITFGKNKYVDVNLFCVSRSDQQIEMNLRWKFVRQRNRKTDRETERHKQKQK